MANESHPSGWRLARLSELGEVNRGRSRHRPRYADHLYGGPYPFIQTGDVKNSRGRVTTYEQTYSEEGLAQSRLWPEGTMCITIAANIAETGILAFPACFPDSVVGFVADPAKCDVCFVEYTFRHMRQQIQHEASGSVQDNINLETLERLRFPLPPLPEQHAIAHILGTLDDKIALNRQMNQTLEQIAAALFTSWFVDFDPVRAKAARRQPEGMDAETAALFPDWLVESEIGDIPEGWEPSTVANDFEITMGQSPPGETYNEIGEGLPFYQGRVDFGFRFPGRRIYCTSPTRLASKGDTLLSVRAPVGSLNVAIEACAIGRGVGALRHKLGGSSFTYYSLMAMTPQFEPFNGEGTVFGSISRNDLLRLPSLAPSRLVIDAFDHIATPLDARIQLNEQQGRTLVELRDTLLPRLLSGELRAPLDVLDQEAVSMPTPEREDLLVQSRF